MAPPLAGLCLSRGSTLFPDSACWAWTTLSHHLSAHGAFLPFKTHIKGISSRGSPTLSWAPQSFVQMPGTVIHRPVGLPVPSAQHCMHRAPDPCRCNRRTPSLRSLKLRPGPATRIQTQILSVLTLHPHLCSSPRSTFYIKYGSSFVNVDTIIKENDFFGHDEKFLNTFEQLGYVNSALQLI